MIVPLSILDLAPIVEGGDAADAFRRSLDLARHAEAWGYRRYWLAEHHNMPGVASAATSVVIAHIAAGTSTIRVGAGGIMLPNHAPLAIAEQFGTLASLFPGRIDLGLGRAPGTDPITAHALRRTLASDPDAFPQDVVELMAYFKPAVSGQRVRAVPGAGLDVPIWILGSSLFGAQVAAALGLPYAFASHFAPRLLDDALDVYRREFQPSETLREPYVMPGVYVIAAETDQEAERQSTSLQQAFVNLRRGRPGPFPPPRPGFREGLDPNERAELDQTLGAAIVGSPETVTAKLRAFVERTKADEVMIACQVFDHRARLRSYELVAQARQT